MIQQVVDLTFHGPMTPTLAELDLDSPLPADHEAFVGRGRHRLAATMQAITAMKSLCKPRTKPNVQTYAEQALAMLKQGTNDPMRFEGADDHSTHMYAVIHLCPPGVSPDSTSAKGKRRNA